ncbi:MAG: N-succinylarginine dihydrolase [Pseudomonadota bacterium]
MQHFEANFDGLVGPSHNFGGLAKGNIASQSNQANTSNPKQAALQGLAKMLTLHRMGLIQGVLAPHARPDLGALRQLGFVGTDVQILEKAGRKSPELLQAVYSASSMWVANAATVSPRQHTADNRVHMTVANLSSHLHRAIEPTTSYHLLRATFNDDQHFAIHRELPFGTIMGDEGAANHTVLTKAYGEPGIEFFVYGQQSLNSHSARPSRYPARQSLEASQAIARLHGLSDDHCVFAQQLPECIDAGVFHNDVIAVGNLNLLFCHEKAFLDQPRVLQTLQGKLSGQLSVIEVADREVSLATAVKTYLFNSQLLKLPNGRHVIVVPGECERDLDTWNYLQNLVESHPAIDDVLVVDIKQSMRNGGGPACLRLRVPLDSHSLKRVNSACLMNEEKYQTLYQWVERHYRDRVDSETLLDPEFMTENFRALDELTQILSLGSVYPFQQT